MEGLSWEQARQLVELSFPEYSAIRSEYWRKVNEGVETYLTEPTKDDDWFKGLMRAAIELAFLNAAMVAAHDGGESELTVGLLAFVTAYKVAEFSFVESLLLSLRSKKYPPGGISPEDELNADLRAMEQAQRRADGYAQGLDILFNNVKVRAAGNKLLLFGGDDGMESCFDCQKYKGLRHPAWWWIKHNAVPPNRDFECKGYKCLHVLLDDKLHIFTI
jgi:hypothetical protein